MKNYDILLMDLDNTLIDDVENIKRAFEKVVSEFHLETYQKTFAEFFSFDSDYWNHANNPKFPIPYTYETKEEYTLYKRSYRFLLFFDENIPIEKAIQMNQCYMDGLLEEIVPFPNAIETVQTLSEYFKIVIATNGPLKIAEHKIKTIGIEKDVMYLFSSEMTKIRMNKPHPGYFDELLEYINYSNRDKILVIGDSLPCDIQGGILSNMDTCWVNLKNIKNETDFIPNYEIHSLKQLQELLLQKRRTKSSKK